LDMVSTAKVASTIHVVIAIMMILMTSPKNITLSQGAARSSRPAEPTCWRSQLVGGVNFDALLGGVTFSMT
ncbi:hypothetical protein, partial [Arenicella xantha]|uniref:hypothetical protein n=1 Tax=Arenicella xantha TaxID=644221 RepID=UPI001B87BB44